MITFCNLGNVPLVNNLLIKVCTLLCFTQVLKLNVPSIVTLQEYQNGLTYVKLLSNKLL